MLRDVKLGTRLMCVILLIALSAVLATSIVSYVEMRALAGTAGAASVTLGEAVTDETRKALLSVAEPEAIIEPAERIDDVIDMHIERSSAQLQSALSGAVRKYAVLTGLTALAVLLASLLLTGTLTKPIIRLLACVRSMGGGDLTVRVPEAGRDEIGELGTAFNMMSDDLTAYIANFAAAQSEKERLGSELSVAANIQNDMLPDVSPNFSALPCLRLHAKMEAAKEVGGDFYDFFFLDAEKTKLCLVIADVSGKGVPAALFMVVAKTLLKTYLLQGGSVAAALMRVNDLLAEDNAHNMFVTAFAGVLDTATGDFAFANAGHNPPLLYHDGAFSFMKIKRSMPLASMEGLRYRDEQTTLEPGDALYLYTDGAPEAMSEQNELFGEEALKQALTQAGPGDPERMDAFVRAALKQHAGRAEQSDDITTLSVVYVKRAAVGEAV